jgi:uncharacterized membrane protein YbhN (UPF0104 family)
MDSVMRSRLLRAVALLAVLAAVVYTLASLTRQTSLAEIGAVLASVDMSSLVLWGVPVLAVGFVFRAARFRWLLRDDDGHHPRMPLVLAAVILSQAANNVLPLRAGELVRTHEFRIRSYPLLRVGVAQVVEKGIEFVSILGVAVIGAVFGMLGQISAVWLAVAVAGLGLVGLLCTRLSRVRAWLTHAASWSSVDLAISLTWAVLADVAEIALVAVSLHALGLEASCGVSVAIFAAVNIAIALPSTPGHFGPLEAGAAAALAATGVSSERALAFAVLYRVIQWVPLMLAGGAIAIWRRIAGGSRARLAEIDFRGGKSV